MPVRHSKHCAQHCRDARQKIIIQVHRITDDDTSSAALRRDAPASQPWLGYSVVFAAHKRPKRRHRAGFATAGKVTYSSSSSSPLGRETSSSSSSFFLLRPDILARGLKQRQLARIYVFEGTDGWILMADGWEQLVREKRRREGRQRGRGVSGVVEGQRLGAQAKWYVPSRQRLRETRAAKSRGGGEEGGLRQRCCCGETGRAGSSNSSWPAGRGTLGCAPVRCVTLEKVGTSGSRAPTPPPFGGHTQHRAAWQARQAGGAAAMLQDGGRGL